MQLLRCTKNDVFIQVKLSNDNHTNDRQEKRHISPAITQQHIQFSLQNTFLLLFLTREKLRLHRGFSYNRL